MWLRSLRSKQRIDWGVWRLRILLKIFLFPISLILSIFVSVGGFLVCWCAALLNMVSAILFLGVSGLFIHYLTGWPFGTARNPYDLQAVIWLGIVSFLFSPFGLPKLLFWLVCKINELNCAIKSI